jgi:hypothetical protein
LGGADASARPGGRVGAAVIEPAPPGYAYARLGGGVRCTDCRHSTPHDRMPWIGRCNVGERGLIPGGLWWRTDRHGCRRFERCE